VTPDAKDAQPTGALLLRIHQRGVRCVEQRESNRRASYGFAVTDSDAQSCSSGFLAEASADVLDLSNDFRRLVVEQAQSELVTAKPCAHLSSSTTIPND